MDGRLLGMARWTIRLDARPMAAPTPCGRSMGCAKVAAWAWRLHIRSGPVALTSRTTPPNTD